MNKINPEMDPTQKLIQQVPVTKKKKVTRRYIDSIYRYDNTCNNLSLTKSTKETTSIYSNRDLYKIINELKDDLSRVKNFDMVRKLSNPFEYSRNVSGSVIDRAYIKIANIHYIIPLFDQNKPIVRFADVAGGPGGWTKFLMDTLHKNKQEYEGNLITLNSETDVLNWHEEILDASERTESDDSVKKENIYISYGEDNTGDITIEENILSFTDDIKNSLDLVVTDGGIGSDILQEHYHYKLFMAETIIALRSLAIGGTYLMKVYDLYTEYSMNLVYLISYYFDYIYIVKPISSRPANSERYIVAKGLNKLITDEEFNFLISALDNTVNIGDLSSIVRKKPKYNEAILEANLAINKKKYIYKFMENVPEDFKTYLKNVNIINGIYQRKYLEEIFICSEKLDQGIKSYTNGKSYDLHKSLVLWKVIDENDNINKRHKLRLIKNKPIVYEIDGFEENSDEIDLVASIKDCLYYQILVERISHYILLIFGDSYLKTNNIGNLDKYVRRILSSFLLNKKQNSDYTVRSIYENNKEEFLEQYGFNDKYNIFSDRTVLYDIKGIDFVSFFKSKNNKVYVKYVFSGLAMDIISIPISHTKLSNLYYYEQLTYSPGNSTYSIERMPKKDLIESLLNNDIYSERLTYSLLMYSVYSYKYMFYTPDFVYRDYNIEVEMFGTSITRRTNYMAYESSLYELQNNYGAYKSLKDIDVKSEIFEEYSTFLFNPSPDDPNIMDYVEILQSILDENRDVLVICVLQNDNGPSQELINELSQSNYLQKSIKYDADNIRYYDNINLRYKTIKFNTELLELHNKER